MWVRDAADLTLLTSAQLDFYMVDGSHALIIDFKTGFKKPTPSEVSWQSRTQAVALWQAFPQVTSIRAGFASSRLLSSLDLTDYQLSDLHLVYNEIRNILWRTRQPDAPRVPGPWCQHCKARGLCRENIAYTHVVDVGVPSVKGRSNAVKADDLQLALMIGKMKPAEMGYIFKRKAIVESVFTALKQRLLELPEEQLKEAGFEKVPGNNYKDITDNQAAFNRLGTILTPDELYSCMKIVRGTATEILAMRTGITKKAAEEKVLATLGDAVTPRQGDPKLKPL